MSASPCRLPSASLHQDSALHSPRTFRPRHFNAFRRSGVRARLRVCGSPGPACLSTSFALSPLAP
eukprot:13506771-Alexandrium_andersonii.AAC.1